MKKLFSVILLAVVVSLVSVILLADSRTAIPEFSAKNLQGQVIDNHQLKGKITLINFWFPSCPGCVTEMPKLVKMAHDYQGKNFQIIAVAVPFDSLATVQEYVKQRELPFNVIFDKDKTITQSFVKKDLFPTSVLINQRGEILNIFVGEPNFSDLYQLVDKELVK